MDELRDWLRRQADRERRVPRLESALLTDRFAAYFAYRLRFFLGRTVIASIVRAIKVVLLFQVFSREEFVAIVVVMAGASVVGDLWWGALERMRAQIRRLRRDGAPQRVPAEAGRWLRLAIALSGVGLAIAVGWLVLRFAAGGASVADLFVAVVVGATAIEISVRTYHSTAFALRRVYRPLPSLLVADTVSLAMLVVGLPLGGVLAFPVAEVTASVAAAAISLHYTAQACRLLGYPPLLDLIRSGRSLPSMAGLRAALAPGLAYAAIGVESFVLLAVLRTGNGFAATTLIAFLAALSPAVRAGFEWARLLYFDFKRLDLPLLGELRRRFDGAVSRLALVVGLAVWAVAAAIGVLILGIREPVLLLAMLPFFVARSLLAATQIRAFSGAAYVRLILIGAVSAVAFALIASLDVGDDLRVLTASLVLGVTTLALAAYPMNAATAEDAILSLPDWLAHLGRVAGPVAVTFVRFDDRPASGEPTAEHRRLVAWRKRRIARRIRWGVSAGGGQVTWLGPIDLGWFEPARRREGDDVMSADAVIGLAGGHLSRPPTQTGYPDGAAAARAVVQMLLGRPVEAGADPADGGDVDALASEFSERWPSGFVLRPDRGSSPGQLSLPSADHRAILRAALLFAQGMEPDRTPSRWDVTSFASDGRLRAIFVRPWTRDRSGTSEWHDTVREAALRAALGATVKG